MDEFKDKAKSAARTGFAALKEPEGLATAALGAFLINPLVGLALGVGQGLLARRDRQSALDDAAAEREILQQMDAMHQDAMASVQGLAATDLDREQLTQMGPDFQTLRTLAMSPDPSTRQAAIQKLAEQSSRVGDWLEDLEGRNETVFDKNVSLLDEQGVVARQNFEKGLERAQSVQRIASDMHQLLSDETFDVNNPISRARLGQLLDQTPREFLADPADMSDALEKVGANAPGVIGAIMSYYAGKKKAEEFTFTKEDWRKVAHAMLSTSSKLAERNMADAERSALYLDRAAKGINHAPAISYLDRVITGRVQDGQDVSDAPGVYDEADRAAAAVRAAEADRRDAANPSKASAAVSSVKSKAKEVVLDLLDPWGMFRKDPTAPLARKRPTN